MKNPILGWMGALLMLGLPAVGGACGSNPTGQETPADTLLPSLSGDYLGQTPPGTTFQRFAPGVVPSDQHSGVTLSPDGREILWTDGNGIMATERVRDRWTVPTYLPFSGASGLLAYDDVPVISPDNGKLFFLSQRTVPFSTENLEHIWVAERTSSGWSEPTPLSPVVNSTPGIHWQFSLTISGTLYFGAYDGERHRIFSAQHEDGGYLSPDPVTAINEFSDVVCPFIAPDESYLIFKKIHRDQPGGPFIPDDYFISFKGNHGQWSVPQALEGFPDMMTSFVTRDGGFVFAQEFWASAQVIDEFRPPPSQRRPHGVP